MVRINREFFDDRFAFSGEVETDLQYNPTRWYDPTLGRWLSEEPIGNVNFYGSPRQTSPESTYASRES